MLDLGLGLRHVSAAATPSAGKGRSGGKQGRFAEQAPAGASARKPARTLSSGENSSPLPAGLLLNQKISGCSTLEQLGRVLSAHSSPDQGASTSAAHDPDQVVALNAINVATAWSKLASLRPDKQQQQGEGQDKPPREQKAPGRDGDGVTRIGLARDLAGVTLRLAPSLDTRQVAAALWGVAKVLEGDRATGGAGAGQGQGQGQGLGGLLAALQQRAAQLLNGSSAAGGTGTSGGDRVAALDLRDAGQLWYSVAQLPYAWDGAFLKALSAATLAGITAALGDGAAASASGVAGQALFRMGLQGVRLERDAEAQATAAVERAASLARDGVGSPDCWLTGAYLLRLRPSREAVRGLHDAVLSAPREQAVRVGRTAMARALHSAVQLGYQPGEDEALEWEARLVAPGGVAAGADARIVVGGSWWTSDELSWVMLALSAVASYSPDRRAEEVLVDAIKATLRRARGNDATRVRAAVKAWGLDLPPRERALLALKTGADLAEEGLGPGEVRGGRYRYEDREERGYRGRGVGGRGEQRMSGRGRGSGPRSRLDRSRW